ncbi:DUF3263 domain-containing protein [Mycetocola sp. 2940]|uniref:DUF3263 domain-containing protein n=1 Tax=Mycetocola sp. 2940 TaxID=3156452 RepID=UPI0033983AC6
MNDNQGSPSRQAEPLGERDLAILAFENRWWQHAGQKEEAVRAAFGFSPTRYYQLLGALIDSPAALMHDPLLVKRLQRLRDTRQAARRARARNAD